jgi:hypothetical protein
MFVTIRRHSDEDLSRADVDSGGIRLQNWPVLSTHPFPSLSASLAGLCRPAMIWFVCHAAPFRFRQRPSRAMEVLF